MASGFKKPLSAPEHLVRLANYKMPFGKYKNCYLVNIPEPYYVWFKQKGFLQVPLETYYKKCMK